MKAQKIALILGPILFVLSHLLPWAQGARSYSAFDDIDSDAMIIVYAGIAFAVVTLLFALFVTPTRKWPAVIVLVSSLIMTAGPTMFWIVTTFVESRYDIGYGVFVADGFALAVVTDSIAYIFGKSPEAQPASE
jgi:hypothetical protein